jgi:flagellar hook-length control protein FliK
MPLLAASFIAPTVLLHAGNGRLAPAGVYEAQPSADDASLRSSIVRAIQMQWKDGSGTAVIKLEPAYLGTVSVSLRVESGLVTAMVRAEDPQVRAWLVSSEATLRQGLAEQGLTLERIAVADHSEHEPQADADGRRRSRQSFDRRHTPPRRNQDRTFEVIV